MQLRLVLNFEGEKHELEYDTEDGRDVLAWQLFSLTGVGVQEQKIHGLFISDSSEDLSESVKDGFEFRLTRRNADPQVDGTATDTTSSPMLESDEELARRLQEEEDVQLARAMAQQLGAERSGGQNVEAFRGRLESGIQTVMQYEHPSKQEKARALIPLDELEERAAVALLRTGESSPEAMRDALLAELLHWFKATFKWVNAPECEFCGGATVLQGMVPPTPEDLRFGASRVEGYACQVCGARTRFPRYNDPGKLLETRRGRCGEWANAFTLCCRALGYEARWVLDWTDHVWTEVYSEAQHRWLHADACEDRLDAPLLYESGWGKKLSYVISFSNRGVTDTTRRYTARWGEVLTRRADVSEDDVVRLTSECTARLRGGLGRVEREKLEERDRREREELLAGHSPSQDTANLPGRQTGSVEWRAARGELGGGEASTSGTPLKGERPARDEHVAALWASIDAMWAVAQADAAQRGIPSNDGMYSRLTLVLQTAKGLRALRWKERKLEVAEGKKVNGRELSAKGGAAYREALTAGGGGGLLEAVGFRVETDDVMLRLLPSGPPAHIARNLPVAVDIIESLLVRLKTPGFKYAPAPRIGGGFVSASGENAPSQIATAAFEGVKASKWLVHGGHEGKSWLQYRCRQPALLSRYSLTSAEDCPERDPASWILEASSDGDTWHVLDHRNGIRFSERNELRSFEVPGGPNRAAYTTFRFRFTSVRDASAGCLQASGVDLFGTADPTELRS